MWDHLDEPLKADVETVAAAEGQGDKDESEKLCSGNTGAEENAWDTNGPSLAYCMFLNTRMRRNGEKQQSSLR